MIKRVGSNLFYKIKTQLGAGKFPQESAILPMLEGFTTKNENSSAGLGTEILSLHAVQGQNDSESYASYFQSNDEVGASFPYGKDAPSISDLPST